MKDVVFQIEEKFPEAKDIRINGVKMWPFVRIMFRYMVVEKRAQNGASKPVPAGPGPSSWSNIRSKLLANFRLWFRRYDVVIFSNELEKRKIDDKYIDKLSEGIVQRIGHKRTLTINYLSRPDITVREMENRSSVDGNLLWRLTRLRRKYTKLVMERKDREILERILSDYDLAWEDLELQIREMLAKVFVFNRLLKLTKPKLVITSCYSNYAEVFAAKRRGIKTIELQHGIISPLHPGYESLYMLNKDFTADHLFVFGANSVKDLDDHVVIPKNALIVGSYYLELLEARPPERGILELIGNYERSVCVPTDYLTEPAILQFILPVAKRCPGVVFLITPRSDLSEAGAASIEGTGNIIVTRKYPFQEVVRHCTFHTATNSTCCLEALAMGVPNILINTDHSAYELFGGLVDMKYTRFVESADEYIDALQSTLFSEKDEIRAFNKANFSRNYNTNLDKAFKSIGVV